MSNESFLTYDMRDMRKMEQELPELFIEKSEEQIVELKAKVEKVLKEYLLSKIEAIGKLRVKNFPISNYELSNFELPDLVKTYYVYFPLESELERKINTKTLAYYLLSIISVLFCDNQCGYVIWHREEAIEKYGDHIIHKVDFKFDNKDITGIGFSTYKNESPVTSFCWLWNYFQHNLFTSKQLGEPKEYIRVHKKVD